MLVVRIASWPATRPLSLSACATWCCPLSYLAASLGLYMARLVRTAMIEASDRTLSGRPLARASEGVVLYRHGLRNAIIPTITLSGLAIGQPVDQHDRRRERFRLWSGLGTYAYCPRGRALDLRPGLPE